MMMKKRSTKLIGAIADALALKATEIGKEAAGIGDLCTRRNLILSRCGAFRDDLISTGSKKDEADFVMAYLVSSAWGLAEILAARNQAAA